MKSLFYYTIILMVNFQMLKCSVSSETLQILYKESTFGKWIPKVNSTIKLLSTLSNIFQGGVSGNVSVKYINRFILSEHFI